MTLGIATVVFAVPINLQISANYYSHTLEFSGTFASTDVGPGVTSIQKVFSSAQMATPSSVIPTLSVNNLEAVQNGFLSSTFNGMNFPVKQSIPDEYNFSIDNSLKMGLNFQTSVLSALLNYDQPFNKLSAFSAGFNLGPFSTLGYMYSKGSNISITLPDGISIGGSLTAQSTIMVNANLPFSIGNFLFNAGVQYVASPSTFSPKIGVFYMGDVTPYVLYDAEFPSTPTISVGLNSTYFSTYVKMTTVSTAVYSIGGSYRSPIGILGVDLSIQHNDNLVNANFSSVPFGFSFLQFLLNGNVALDSNGAYAFNTSLSANLSLFSSNIEGWFGVNRTSNGMLSNFYGMDVNF